MKNKDAMFRCRNRNVNPKLVSREMWITVSNVFWICAVYCVAKTIPVTICAAIQIPSIEPRFHR